MNFYFYFLIKIDYYLLNKKIKKIIKKNIEFKK
jgi:hypothetical protein